MAPSASPLLYVLFEKELWGYSESDIPKTEKGLMGWVQEDMRIIFIFLLKKGAGSHLQSRKTSQASSLLHFTEPDSIKQSLIMKMEVFALQKKKWGGGDGGAESFEGGEKRDEWRGRGAHKHKNTEQSSK